MAIAIVNGVLNQQSARQNMAYTGNYFVATNPTPGTAIAYALKTGFSATANGLFSISNGNPVGGPTIQLDRLKLIQTATAPTGTLIMRSEVYCESGIVAISSAAAAITPVNVNPVATTPTRATVTFFNAGAGTVPAAVGTRTLVGVGSIATGVTVANDSFTFEFGGDGQSSGKGGDTAARATDPADLVTWMSPVTIPPGYSAWMNLWWKTAAANTPSFEWQLGYIEL